MRFRTLVVSLSLGLMTCMTCMSHVGCNSTGDGIPEAPGPFGHTPKIDLRKQIERLDGPVDVMRDKNGVVHIYATTAPDAMRVQGYQLARDRTAQLELIRRLAEGRMAEVLGGLSPDLIDADISARTVGLHRVAKKMYDALPAESEAKKLLDAYADGISQFNARLNSENAEMAEALPESMSLLPLAAFEPWTGADVLAVARFQSQQLSFDVESEIAQSSFIAKWRATFNATATDARLKDRANLLAQYAAFKPIDTATVLPGFPNDGGHVQSQPIEIVPRPIAQMQVVPRAAARAPTPPAAFDAAKGFVSGLTTLKSFLGERPFTGSNNWVVAPSRTTSGHALLASDPHLTLSAPAVFWMVHLNVINASDPAQNLDVSGLAFPGIAGVILGYNKNVGWGATTANYDVSDVYSETLSGDASGVMFNGQSVPFEKIHETIKVQGQDPIEYDVLNVPHHGPVVPTIVEHKVVPPDPAKAVLSMRWTGMQPTNELAAVFGFMRAKNVEDARTAIRNFSVGAQNWVFADTNGDIFYSSQSQIPKRDKRAYTWDPNTFSGTLPCFVLPGDGTAEWTGEYLPEAYVPHVKNPSSGYIATANNDQVGVTLDGDPSNDKLPNGESFYVGGCNYDPGFREARIKQRIEAVGNKMTPEEMASIQADARSPLGAELTPKLLEALGRAEQERATPGSHPDLTAVVKNAAYDPALIAEVQDVLRRWAVEKDYEAAAGLNLDDNKLSTDPGEALASKATLIFNVWLVRMLGATFDDELGKLDFKSSPFDIRVALVNIVRSNDAVLFDDLGTDAVETRDERMVTSLLDALTFLKADPRAGAERNAWRWGAFHTLRFESLVPLWPSLSIPQGGDATFPRGFPRHGDGYNVDVATYSTGTRNLSQVNFSYSHGPTQRFVIEMDPAGPRARNALPGGAVWDDKDKHFRDEAELWRRNQNHAVPFTHDDVKAEAETRTLYSSSPPSK
ncbi:penicillin acylase family protein [Pendulispora brunnea]|uniref:Penicillin acylase family protein n=1 Tax=Pendulispora brunnea TaxID=2905690 RepID=A0ABZ2KPA1_9BACT